MLPPYSVTQASLHLELYKPLRIFVWILAAWPILLLLWVTFAQMTLTVTADVVEVAHDGLITAEFPAETEIAIGQAARIQLVGQQRDVLPATVAAYDDVAAGLVTLLPNESTDRLLLINEAVIVEQVQLIVDRRSPLLLFLGR